MKARLMQGDCLERMKEIESGSVDLVLADVPYGTTACKWDSVIPFAPMWDQINRIAKRSGAAVLFGTEPFSSYLRVSNIKQYRYDWIWNKKKAANFLFGNKQPLKKHEIVSVFYRNQPTYNPDKYLNPNGAQKSGRQGMGKTIFDHLPNAPERSMAGKSYESNKLLPDAFLVYSKPARPIHPTQKPVRLMEYLIKTYTDAGEQVLDFAMGSGTTGVACANLDREFIGVELDAGYFENAEQRIEAARKAPKQKEFVMTV
jgi:DNA modification methylase